MQKHSEEKPFRLITIPISHYCEKARWALERLNISYVEEPHVAGFHRLATQKNGGQSTPLLVTKEGTFSDSTDILYYLDQIAPVSARLYPADPQLSHQVEKLEDLFNTQLGPSVRCWLYFYLLNNRQLMRQLWCQSTPLIEQAFFPIVFPWVRNLVRQKENITAESAASSHDMIRRIFDEVSQQLADGRPYLVGNSFSAADLTFACLAAPVVLPTEYGAKWPQLDELPSEIVTTINELQKTPAGVYTLRLFREERSRKF